jgi:hypothetical protein
VRTCPECEREMYHWHCACGFRTPKPALAKPVVGVGNCPDCTRMMVGDACRCGYRRPGTRPVMPVTEDKPLTEEQRRIGHQHFEQLKAMLRQGKKAMGGGD